MDQQEGFAEEVSRGTFLKFAAAAGLGLTGLSAMKPEPAFAADLWSDQGKFITPSTVTAPAVFRVYDAGGLHRENTISSKPANADYSGIFYNKLTVKEGTSEKPASTYAYTTEIIPYFTQAANWSGHNESLSENNGRTGFPVYRVALNHYGQGDAAAYNAVVSVHGTKAGATHFMAQPAGVILNGDVIAGADHVYLNILEFNAVSKGHECAAIGAVFNFKRDVPGASQGETWQGIRLQNFGAHPCDAAYVAVGEWKAGLDLTVAQFPGARAAIALKANDRIYFNASASGKIAFAQNFRNTWIDYDAAPGNANHGYRFVIDNNPVLQVGANTVTSTADYQTAKTFGQFAVPTKGSFRLNGLNGNTYFTYDGVNVQLVKNGRPVASW